MTTVALNPQDVQETFLHKAHYSSLMKVPRNPSANRPKAAQNNRRHRRSPPRSENAESTCPNAGEKLSAGNLLVPKVKILKRGEDLKQTTPDLSLSKAKSEKSSAAQNSADGILGSSPYSKEQIRVSGSSKTAGFFAGSTSCIASPPPSSLPVPVFFSQKKKIAAPSPEEEVTNALLQILHLDQTSQILDF